MPISRRTLRVGALEATLEGVGLRWIRSGGVEVLRSIEVTVRGPSWDTVLPTIQAVHVRRGRDRLSVSVSAVYRRGAIALDVAARMELTPANVEFVLTGQAMASFAKNRIGLIVLHPPAVAGRKARLTTTEGARLMAFPRAISPDQLATDVTGFEWSPAAGVLATLALDGDEWEIEDQRNWIDASFKTYPTPLRHPFPVVISLGTRIHQRAELQLSGTLARPPSRRRTRLDVRIGRNAAGRLPAIGAGLGDASGLTDVSVADAIRRLGLRFVRFGVSSTDDPSHRHLQRQLEASSNLGLPPEVDVTFDPSRDAEWLAGLLQRLHAQQPGAIGVNLFSAVSRTGWDSDAGSVETWRKTPGAEDIVTGVGTRANFTELNRTWPSQSGDMVTYAINPQVHAFDEVSIIETLETLPTVFRQASAIASGRPQTIVITLRPRFNSAAAAVTTAIPDAPPNDVDPRQGTSFVGAWTTGVLAAAARANIARTAFFETHGMAGLILGPESAFHPLVPRPADRVSPAALVLECFASLSGARSLKVETSAGVIALAARHRDNVRVVIANDREVRRDVAVTMDGTRAWRMRPLTATGRDDRLESRRSTLRLTLDPWEVVRLDG